MNKRLLIACAALCSSLLITSCSKDGDNNNNNNNTGGTARVSFRLTDAPAEYDNVFIDIQKVEVTMEGSAAVTLTPIRPGVYDLLQFANGLDTLLMTADVPAGKVQQIRLVLGNNNSVVVDGNTYALTTPSGQTSGLKLNLHDTFTAGGAYSIWIDFDAGKSIVQTGSGKYQLKPVIRAYSALTDGRIKGIVLPLTALVTVYAVNGTDTFSAIPSDFNGGYLIKGLPSGTYSVTYDASVIPFKDTVITNVNVSYGVTTDLGSILLP